MRTIKALLGDNEKIWLNVDACAAEFAENAAAEGFRFSNGALPTKECIGPFIAVHADMTVANLAIVVWTMSFAGNAVGVPPRFSYDRYLRGEEDYVCRQKGSCGVIGGAGSGGTISFL